MRPNYSEAMRHLIVALVVMLSTPCWVFPCGHWIFNQCHRIPYCSQKPFGQSAHIPHPPRLREPDKSSPTLVPVAFRTSSRIENLFTGDKRIKFTGFHVVIVFDTDDRDIAPIVPSDSRKLEGVFEQFQAELRENDQSVNLFRSIRRFDGADATKAAIFEYLDGLENGTLSSGVQMGKDDVILFWSVTHGNAENSLFLTHNKDRIDRGDLVKRLEFHGNRRLTVLITENCNAVSSEPVSESKSNAKSSVWKSLYFGHQGTVNISSSSRGEEAFAVGGSVFTEGFKRSFDGLRNPKRGVIDVKPADDFVNWVTEFFPTLQTQTRRAFLDAERELASSPGSATNILDKMREQKTQTPQLIRPELVRPRQE
jgi:hypothetical protein